MSIWKKIVAFIFGMILLVGVDTTVSASAVNGDIVEGIDELYPIMGESAVTIGQMINYFQASASYPEFYANTEAPTIYAFAQIYMEECQAEGVRVEVAFAQCMHETAYLQYRNCDVLPSQYNFAGLDTWGKQEDGTIVRGRSYSSVRQGIRAHIQRLKAWAVEGTTADSYSYPCIDADKFTQWWMNTCVGSAPYVEWLEKENNPNGYGWATDTQYADKMLKHIQRCLNASSYTTWYQGENYSAVYNPDYYLQNNPDVASAYGTNGDKAIEHFVNYGMKEGRQGSANFNVHSYKKQYVDLRRAFGNTLKSYYLHYVNCGVKEGRKGVGCTSLQGYVTQYNGIDYSTVYDYNYYITAYPDIKKMYGNDDVAVLEHFVKYGMKEGHQGNSKFNVISYLYQYSDLRKIYGNDLASYYTHYMKYGYLEGRQGTGGSVMLGATKIYNGVDYSGVYDYNYYISKYPDVKNAYGHDDYRVLQHFVNYGMKEGRQGSEIFNVNTYISNYGDLRQAFGNNWKAYYMHYLTYGQREGRRGI